MKDHITIADGVNIAFGFFIGNLIIGLVIGIVVIAARPDLSPWN
jgi:hypothetical protein